MRHAIVNLTIAGYATAQWVKVCRFMDQSVSLPTGALEELAGDGSTCRRCREFSSGLALSAQRLAAACRTRAQVAAEELPWAERWADNRRGDLVEKVRGIAEELRRKAGEIDREVDRFDLVIKGIESVALPADADESDADQAARRMMGSVIHTVLWMVPNLDMDGAQRLADDYRRELARVLAIRADLPAPDPAREAPAEEAAAQ